VSAAIASGNVHAINYFVANNYIKALTELAKAPNQKVLMIPIDAAGVIGSIGGIAEMTREVFGGLNSRGENSGADAGGSPALSKTAASKPAASRTVPTVSSS
jgi:hypothetical protein